MFTKKIQINALLVSCLECQIWSVISQFKIYTRTNKCLRLSWNFGCKTQSKWVKKFLHFVKTKDRCCRRHHLTKIKNISIHWTLDYYLNIFPNVKSFYYLSNIRERKPKTIIQWSSFLQNLAQSCIIIFWVY